MCNEKIRQSIENGRLRYWEVAGKIGIHPATLSTWLRQPLTDNRLGRVTTAIEELLVNRNGGQSQ